MKRLFRGSEAAQDPSTPEEMRAAFQSRYHHFKLLLNANSKALELMSDMEEALRGARPFGMSFVKASSTAVSVNVFRMIRNLQALAPGAYEELSDRFKEIEARIRSALESGKLPVSDRLILPLREIDKEMSDQVGSKMANLGEIRNRLGLPVPNGFIISSSAYHRFMEHNDLQAEIDRRLQTSDVEQVDQMYALSASIQQLIIRAAVPEDLEKAILEAYRELESEEASPGVRVSLRSSALGEDMAGTSFAGQYRSELNVSPENLLDAYKEIVASKYSLQAMTYRLNRGIRDEDIAMCVGCMVMVRAAAGGVLYSRNPLNIRDDTVVLNSVWGLAKSVVDGSVASDLFVVSRRRPLVILRKEVPVKDRKLVGDPEEGVRREDLTEEEAGRPSITEDQALRLAEIGLKLEDDYGVPLDIEWAVDGGGTIYVLQCRPLQQVEAAARKTGRAQEAGTGPEPPILEGGITASPGVGAGPVFVVEKNADVLRFPDGAVLVTAQSLPRWAALLNRSAAVVTEQGSLTGHLANVAREFGVPALFAVPGALSALKNGDVVTIDADACRVYPGRLTALVEQSEARKNLMEGSPVHNLLREVVQHIVPLNLIDPDAPTFRPRRCRTLHDITRFVHEKSVHEMFHFGKEFRFSEHSTKQLVCDVPMQWWVVNLDDGFKREVKEKFVHIDDIASVPMLALWEGIRAVPWEGPPPVDAKGFMAVMFQATANPHLDPAMRSQYAQRNYFMISRNFCTLQSRFGFHFSTVETLVSERALENYISFQFKGGAADFQRRQRRVLLVSEILEECGFRVQIKEDAVFSRLEGYDEPYMKERLRILGYLIIHTRQLDMIMSDPASAQKYRAKIQRDLAGLREASPGA
ncbi:MAG: PEP/pyruvate-binding domain-containing protein [bacterium]